MKLKYSLILQSFAPLFLLLLVKYFRIHLISLVFEFIDRLVHGDFSAFVMAIKHKDFLLLIVAGVCIAWLILSVRAYLQFTDFQMTGFEEDNEMEIKGDTTDTGLGFFMTFVLPLVLDDLGSLQDFLMFLIMMIFVIILMWRTNLYYQNPVLTILGYRTFKFEIKNPEDKRFEGNEYIGITMKKIKGTGTIKYQYIADDVFVIYDKNRGIKNAKRKNHTSNS